jgi:hypothetical protein
MPGDTSPQLFGSGADKRASAGRANSANNATVDAVNTKVSCTDLRGLNAKTTPRATTPTATTNYPRQLDTAYDRIFNSIFVGESGLGGEGGPR